MREFAEQTLRKVKARPEEDGAQLHVSDATGVKVQDQIGTGYAPKGETPVLEGRDSQIELHWLPRYAPEYTPDALLTNDLKQEL